jgi:hypothetical protein
VFRQFVLFCRELNLFGDELIEVDAKKPRAVKSFNRSFTKAVTEKWIKDIDGRIDRYIVGIGMENELEERQWRSYSAGQYQKAEGELGALLQTQGGMESSGKHEISLKGSDCRAVRYNGLFFAGYNARAAVDGKNQLIAEYDVTNKTVVA